MNDIKNRKCMFDIKKERENEKSKPRFHFFDVRDNWQRFTTHDDEWAELFRRYRTITVIFPMDSFSFSFCSVTKVTWAEISLLQNSLGCSRHFCTQYTTLLKPQLLIFILITIGIFLLISFGCAWGRYTRERAQYGWKVFLLVAGEFGTFASLVHFNPNIWIFHY